MALAQSCPFFRHFSDAWGTLDRVCHMAEKGEEMATLQTSKWAHLYLVLEGIQRRGVKLSLAASSQLVFILLCVAPLL